jgi:hypothetical protein
MRTAPRAAAWAAWAAWICNRAIAGGAAAGNDWLQSQESGLRPALYFRGLDVETRPSSDFNGHGHPSCDKKHLAGGTVPPIASCDGAAHRRGKVIKPLTF